MNADLITTRILDQIEKESGLELARTYLDISKIAGCPRAAVNEYNSGLTPTPTGHRMAYAGYEQERSIARLLCNAGVFQEGSAGREVVAPFDDRLRGHIDGLTINNELLEIKSLSIKKFEMLQAANLPLKNHVVQTQLYLRYGHWKKAFLIYRCRDTYEHAVMPITYNEDMAVRYERKAKQILQAIDDCVLPPCTCSHCK